MNYDFISIGSAVKDIFLFLRAEDYLLLDNPRREPTRKKLLALEHGAKINVVRTAVAIGGGAVNSATTFSRLGFKTALAAALGGEEGGQAVRRALRQEKIDASFLTGETEEITGFSVILSPEDGGDRVVLVERGANDNLKLKASWLARAKCLYLTAISGEWRPELDKIASAAKKGKIQWVWNPGAEQLASGWGGIGRYLKYCAVFMLNRDEALELVGSGKDGQKSDKPLNLLNAILAWGPERAVITDGVKGAYYADNEKSYFMSADSEVKCVQATGAGDAFGSGFIAGLAMTNWQNVPLALDLGISNAESVIGQIGSRAGILRKKDLAALLGKKKHTLNKIKI